MSTLAGTANSSLPASSEKRSPRLGSTRTRATPTFAALALDVSGVSSSRNTTSHNGSTRSCGADEDDDCGEDAYDENEVWEDYGVVEYLERGYDRRDESTAAERVEDMRETLASETDILETEGQVSDFLFHVARTRHGKAFIRVIRTMLLNKVLCSERMSQMTKTYNDIEAVTRLLEEKEKDLELTARIGKELLSHNQKLETTVQELENELKTANEKITQLTYELSKKTDLIQVLTNDVEESIQSEAEDSSCFRGVSLDAMQKKISTLEEENKSLRTEFTKLADETDICEQHEAQLVKDITDQLANANLEVHDIVEELERHKEESRVLQEENTGLLERLQQAELKLAQLLAEHDEVNTSLAVSKDVQNALAEELAKYKDEYTEALNMLEDLQAQLKTQRKREMPTVRGGSLFPSLATVSQPDSIAAEMECSLFSEMSLDSGISADRNPLSCKKAFDVVKIANRAITATTDSCQYPRLGGTMTTSIMSSGSFGPRSCSTMKGRASSNSVYSSLGSGAPSEYGSSLMHDMEYPGPPKPGVPGAPGAAELEAALRRLTTEEIAARRACLSSGAGYHYDYDASVQTSPHGLSHVAYGGCRTPDSIMSTGSSDNLSRLSTNSSTMWKMPEKLQIVKPLEGSATMRQWTRLATPSLAGLLDERPGIRTRGGKNLEDLGLEKFSLMDFEEDEEYDAYPGKLFQNTGSVYTFTNSTVMHPDDASIMTSSIPNSIISSVDNSAFNSGMNTPRALSRRESTSTFSTNFGIAKLLNERGVKTTTSSSAATPNAANTSFTPTTTPCNSPDISPSSSRSSSPTPTNSTSSTFGLFFTGAEILKRTLVGDRKKPDSQLPRRSRRDHPKRGRPDHSSILGSGPALQGALYSRRESPMAQLTFLKGSMSSEKLRLESSSSASDASSRAKSPGGESASSGAKSATANK
ncbi:trafficking kinesin-binding protein milt isoform X1 [Trichogramma pretiosum]|uniref:trafficking kinesin-binding protein milt isoform X1 n=2 Tax=Trichogramma pretiosum TaxID=7493 RepID=UPI0006C978BA|nr:trafficking kinesin-binding protein milt isoform X1 [Trichogramma pretiosum]